MRWRPAPLLAALAAAGLSVPTPADTITLVSGETLTGQLVERTGQQVIFEHPVLGHLTVSLDQVTAVTPPPSTAPSKPKPPTEPAPPSDPASANGVQPPEREGQPGFLADWDASLSIGFAGTRGNGDTQSFNTEFDATRENEAHRWILEASYFYATDDGSISENEFNAQLNKDWLLPDSKWFYFARLNAEYDQLKPWDFRAGGFGGVGYEFVKREDLEIRGRLGAGATREFGGDGELTPEALVGGAVARWQITEEQELSAEATLYPALDEMGEFRLVSSAEWTMEVSEATGLSLKLGVKDEYDSDVEPEEDHNDLKYYGAVVYDF